MATDNLDPPQQPGHFWKYLSMGPDGKPCFNAGAPGNIGLPHCSQATIQVLTEADIAVLADYLSRLQ